MARKSAHAVIKLSDGPKNITMISGTKQFRSFNKALMVTLLFSVPFDGV
jgi:hypothetical protein